MYCVFEWLLAICLPSTWKWGFPLVLPRLNPLPFRDCLLTSARGHLTAGLVSIFLRGNDADKSPLISFFLLIFKCEENFPLDGTWLVQFSPVLFVLATLVVYLGP